MNKIIDERVIKYTNIIKNSGLSLQENSIKVIIRPQYQKKEAEVIPVLVSNNNFREEFTKTKSLPLFIESTTQLLCLPSAIDEKKSLLHKTYTSFDKDQFHIHASVFL